MAASSGITCRDLLEPGDVDFLRQQLPRFCAKRRRGVDGIDSGEDHRTQDERQHGGRQIGALRQPAGGNDPAVVGLRQGVGQSRAADRIDNRRPALRLQRLADLGEIGPVNELGCPEPVQISAEFRTAPG